MFSLFSSLAISQPLYSANLMNRLKDSDLDGVINARDLCAHTAQGIDVDIHGCPLTELESFSFDFDVQFNIGSAKLRPEYHAHLQDLATFLQQAPDTQLLIEGHTDNTGTEGYNLTLSKKRAEAIAGALMSTFNIDPKRIKTLAYGQERPIASNDTEVGRTRNRRVSGEIVVPFHYKNEAENHQDAKHPRIGRSDLIIPFKSNRDSVKEIYRPSIQSLGKTLQDNPDTLLIIEGHTDNVGRRDYNLALSIERANKVAEMIRAQFSISKNRLKVRGYGQDVPITSNATEAGRKKNRRVSTEIVKTFKATQKVPLPKWTIWSVDEMDQKTPKN
ncbi:OmpA family protein [Marinomonas sp. M1K-6]|uniref:OmpA family protein n=1 Tax=Marinomonas profundi TaxID=2726122 RepID=A0A847QUI2_9GAMM|nr:OmpA family protein [Marinomonas profundi]NLQ16048.1 OmpA family protein [Marinomonas profundi]UDV03362.1 OmpA family protein [Marinomonas profundi]